MEKVEPMHLTSKSRTFHFYVRDGTKLRMYKCDNNERRQQFEWEFISSQNITKTCVLHMKEQLVILRKMVSF